ncbi:hypothetical protein AYI68_g4903, partial [Smittium mucronatum]|jgi:hypothetical protein
MITN